MTAFFPVLMYLLLKQEVGVRHIEKCVSFVKQQISFSYITALDMICWLEVVLVRGTF